MLNIINLLKELIREIKEVENIDIYKDKEELKKHHKLSNKELTKFYRKHHKEIW